MIGQDVEIAIIEIQGDQVRLGINAPKAISIHRKEVFDEIRQENREASIVKLNTDDLKTVMENYQTNKHDKDKKSE